MARKRLVFLLASSAFFFLLYLRLSPTLSRTSSSQGNVTSERVRITPTSSFEQATTTLTTKTTAASTTTKKQRCSPASKIVFAKTHKTAGSTVYTIINEHLRRIGSARNKQGFFPLPFIGGYPGFFNEKFLISKNGQKIGSSGENRPEVVSGHFRFNKSAFEHLMAPETRYITILRNPFDVFHSSFYYYYGSIRHYNVNNKGINCFNSPYSDIMGRFNATLSEYLRIAPSRLGKKMPWYFRSMNHQAHDLGLDPTKSDPEYISQQIRMLESSFDLVMIAEYFLESLVLLRQELCMDWSCLSAGVMNKGKYGNQRYTAYEKSAIRSLNKLDYALYSHFNKTLWKKIRAYGTARMAADIKKISMMPSAEQKLRILKELEKDSKPVNNSNAEILKEDLSKYYKADMVARMAERITEHSPFSPTDERVRQLADYMIANSGGCNL